MADRTDVAPDTYVRRMASAGDKAMIVGHIPEGAKVLDFGCGGGALAGLVDPDHYTGYDRSEGMVERARQVHPRHAFTTAPPADGKFDVVVLSSVLHEVATQDVPEWERYLLVMDFVAGVTRLLRPRGPRRVIIRDGLIARPDADAEYRLLQPTDAHYFRRAAATHGRTFAPMLLLGDRITGPHRQVADFLNLYTWGWESLAREAGEVVNVFTAQQWRDLASDSGDITHFETYSQREYFEHLGRIVDLGGDTWDTKALLVLDC